MKGICARNWSSAPWILYQFPTSVAISLYRIYFHYDGIDFCWHLCNWCDSRSIGHHLSQHQRNRFISLHRKSVWFHQFSSTHRTIQSSAVIVIEAKLKRFLFSKYFETLFSRMKSRGWLVQRTDLVVKNRCWGEKPISSNILECENKRGRYFNVNLCNTLSKSHASHIHMKRAYSAYAPKRTHTYIYWHP